MSSFPKTPEEPVKEEAQGTSGDFILFDMRSLTHFREEAPVVQVLSDTGAARIILFACKAGQHLKDHHTSSHILIKVLRGRIIYTVAGHDANVRVGMVLQVEAKVPHSVLAQTDAAMLLIMTPSPLSHHADKEREDAHDLTPLVTGRAAAAQEA